LCSVRYASMADMERADNSLKVWLGSIRARSTSGTTPKTSRTWSNISRCCPVTQTWGSRSELSFMARITGLSLIASGRVPKMKDILFFKLNVVIGENPRVKLVRFQGGRSDSRRKRNFQVRWICGFPLGRIAFSSRKAGYRSAIPNLYPFPGRT
jgi:hypothetical protein